MMDAINQSPTDRSWTEFVAVLITVIGFVLIADLELVGAASAAAIVVAWLLLPVLYTVVFGHLLVAALTVNGFETLAIITVGAGLFGMILTSAPALYDRGTVTSMIVFVFGALVFVFGIAFVSSDALWIGALTMLVVGALASYGIHRYELVSLGLIEGST